MSDLLKNIDARTRLAGTNKLEILLFSLGMDGRTGRRETFGINVFKVREVMRTPPITRVPDMPRTVVGMVSLRGQLVPVIDLALHAEIPVEGEGKVMIVTEYNSHTQGFLVAAVEKILRVEWSAMKIPPQMLTTHLGSLVTAVSDLKDGRLIMMVDVERILAETAGYDDDKAYVNIRPLAHTGRTVVYADDSAVARKQIERTLEALGIHHIGAVNGQLAWQALQRMADTAESAGKPVHELVQAVLTDVEMPEMDGYMLTKLIKADSRFAGIPVVMHSSLSSLSNQQLGRSVGVDEYVPKFEPEKLAQTLERLLGAEAQPCKA
jgi:two-component system chemotaxis response regulator CheV